jgi:zinc/manganese transport system ATP-binding protein
MGAFGGATPQIAAKARRALTAVGLEGFERRHIGALSAGQLQRVLFARLLLQDAKVIILDEPFTAIGFRSRGCPFDAQAHEPRWRCNELA